MAFSTYRAYFEFERKVRFAYRFIHAPDTLAFLDEVSRTSVNRHAEMEQGVILWRAQLGHGWEPVENQGETFDVACAHPPDRMRPLLHNAPEGRVNPKGIACLYLASDQETAVAEVRPAVGDYVSAGQFKLVKPIRIVDFSKGHASGIALFFQEPDSEERESAVWNDMDRAFSEPITRGDETSEYIPTQIISEYFRQKGFDGIGYKSKLGPGFNLALFDVSSADIVNCGLYSVESVKYKFEQAANPYHVRKPIKIPGRDG